MRNRDFNLLDVCSLLACLASLLILTFAFCASFRKGEKDAEEEIWRRVAATAVLYEEAQAQVDTLVFITDHLTTWQELLLAIAYTESRFNPQAVGKDHDTGVLQLTPIYIREANRNSDRVGAELPEEREVPAGSEAESGRVCTGICGEIRGAIADADLRDDEGVSGEYEGKGREERLQERDEVRKPGISDQIRPALLESSPDARRGSRESKCNLEGGESRRDGPLCYGSKRASSHSDGAGREKPLQPGREAHRQEDGAGLDDRTLGPRGDGKLADTIGERLEGKDQPRPDQEGERLRLRRDLAGRDWEGLRPGERWASFPTVSPVHRGNDGLPFNVDGLTISFTSWRTESLKAYGNAIVPQVMYRIFEAIEKVSK